MLAASRHLSARNFQALHFGYFPSEEVFLTAGGDDIAARYTPHLGRYEVPLARLRDDDEAIILTVCLAVAELEL